MTNISRRSTCLLALVFVLQPWIAGKISAQNVDYVAEREASRRQAALPRGQEALGRAKAAMAEKNYAVAHEEFRAALKFLPDAVVSATAHDEAVSGFCASGIKLAEQRTHGNRTRRPVCHDQDRGDALSSLRAVN